MLHKAYKSFFPDHIGSYRAFIVFLAITAGFLRLYWTPRLKHRPTNSEAWVRIPASNYITA